MKLVKIFSAFTFTIITFAQQGPNQCAYSSSSNTVTAKCYVMHNGSRIDGSGSASIGGAGAGFARTMACADCRSDMNLKINPNGGTSTFTSGPQQSSDIDLALQESKQESKNDKKVEKASSSSSVTLQNMKFEKYKQLPNGDLELTCSVVKDGKEVREKAIAKKSASASMQRQIVQSQCIGMLAQNFAGDMKTASEMKKELADKMGQANFSDCLKHPGVNKKIPDADARAKWCFDYADRTSKKMAQQLMDEKCKRRSPDSIIVQCEDGSTYKLVDDRGGPLGPHDELGKNVNDISRHLATGKSDARKYNSTEYNVNSSQK